MYYEKLELFHLLIFCTSVYSQFLHNCLQFIQEVMQENEGITGDLGDQTLQVRSNIRSTAYLWISLREHHVCNTYYYT